MIKICVILHSLSISIQKYIVVVHRINDNSERYQLEKVLLVLFSLFSILGSAALIVRSSSLVPVNSSWENCFRMGIMWWGQHNDKSIQGTQSDAFTHFCKFDPKEGNFEEDAIIYFITEIYCIAQTVLNTMTIFNIFEAFVYYKIFQFINR